MEREIDELLSDVAEIEQLLAAARAGQNLNQVGMLADLIAGSAPNDGIAKRAEALRKKAHAMMKRGSAGNSGIELMKDAALRLRISLLALKRGGSPIE